MNPGGRGSCRGAQSQVLIQKGSADALPSRDKDQLHCCVESSQRHKVSTVFISTLRSTHCHEFQGSSWHRWRAFRCTVSPGGVPQSLRHSCGGRRDDLEIKGKPFGICCDTWPQGIRQPG